MQGHRDVRRSEDGAGNWHDQLERGDTDGAWSAFDQAYGRLILSVIRRLVSEPDHVEEVLAHVQAGLSADGLARLRRFSLDDPSGAALPSWLVVVVRRLVIDWLRQEHGRRRSEVPGDLDEWRRAMFIARCLERLTAAETFELLRDRSGGLAFPAFLRELRALARSHPCPELRPARLAMVALPAEEPTAPSVDAAEASDQSRRLHAMLTEQPHDMRLAIQLFVIDELPASEVARIVGWPNPKAVYNRVGRALRQMRDTLQAEGIGSGDL